MLGRSDSTCKGPGSGGSITLWTSCEVSVARRESRVSSPGENPLVQS